MTLGEKIKYFRVKKEITQDQLAELTGIHPVSIRKYETNKMIPKQEIIEKIAEALNINAIALTGVDIPELKFDTAGDVMGSLMTLISSGVLNLDWDEKNLDSLTIKVNPVFSKFMDLVSVSDASEKHSPSEFSLEITHKPLVEDLLMWYSARTSYLNEKATASEEDIENKMSFLNQVKVKKEHAENWLQSDVIAFDEMLEKGLELHEAEKNEIIKDKE